MILSFRRLKRELRRSSTDQLESSQDFKPEFLKTIYPEELGKLEKLLKTHANGEKFVLGDKVNSFLQCEVYISKYDTENRNRHRTNIQSETYLNLE